MKSSSSELEALIGGAWVFFTFDPPIEYATPPAILPRTAIANYIALLLAYLDNKREVATPNLFVEG